MNISRTTIAATTTNKVSVENTSKSVVNPESLSGIKSISQPVKIVPHQQVRQQSEGIVAGVAKIAITTTEQPQITARNPTIRSGAENKVDNIIVPSNSSPGSEFTGTGVSGPISISSNTKNPSPAGKSPDQKSSKLVESSPGATDYLGASGAAYNHTVPEKIPGRNLEALAKQRIPSPTGDQRKGSPLPVDTETSPRIISGLPLVGNALSTAEVPTSPSRQSLLHKSPHFSPSNLPHSLQSASAGSHRMATSPNVGEDSAIVNTLPKSPSGRLLTPMQIIPEASANNAYTRLPVKYEEPLSLSTLGNDRSGRNLLSGTISSTSVKDEYSPDPSIQASSTVRDTGGKSNSTTAPPSGKSPLMNQTEPVQKASANEYHNSNEIPRYEGVETQEATSNGGEQLPHDQSQSNEFQFENQFNEGEVNLEAPSEVLHFNYQESFQFKNPNAGDQYYQSEMKDIYEYNDDGVLDQQHNYLRKRHEQHQENGGLEHPLEFQEYQNYGPQSNANEQNFNQQLGFENNTDIYTQNSNPQMYEAHDSTRLQSNFDNEQISYGEDNYENYGGQYYENENGGLQYENENGGLQYENDYDGQQYEDDYGGQHYQNGDGGPQYANEYNFQQLGIEYHSQQYENEYEGQLYASTYDNQQYGNAYDGQQYEHEYNVQQYNDQQRSDHQIDADYQSELYPSEYLDQENYTHQLRFHGSAFETQGGYNQHQEYREYTELGQQHLNSEAQAEYYPAGAENIGQEQDYEGLTSVDHGDLNQNDFSTYQLHRDQSKSQTLINGPQLLEMKICYPCNLEYEKHMNFCGACGSRLEVPTPIAQNIHQQTKSNTSPVTAMHFHDAQLHQNTIPTIPGAFQRFNCIATFGFNGQLVYTTPIIQTIFQTTNAGVPKPVLKAFPGPIKICKVEKLLDSKILQELNQILKFGPLFSDLRPSQARIIEILENLKVHSESKDFSNLIEYLIILTKK